MTEMPEHTELEVLLHHIKQVEIRLDAATETVEDYRRDHPNAELNESAEFQIHIEREKFEAKEWAKSFDAIISHKPASLEELKYKTLVLIEYLELGHDSPLILKTIKSDLRAFSFGASQNKSNINRKFLLIDDNEIDRMLIRRALSKKRDDLYFVELEYGLTVVDIIKKEQPLATLLDIRMPKLDGYEILNLIRNDEDLADHPIWILAASSEDKDVQIALKSGANGYFVKPNSIADYDMLAETILENAPI